MMFPDLLSKILAGAGVALLFSLAVFIHELGHFLAARSLGLVVDAFSIGFGPAIWKRRIGGVEYRVGMLPLGGYVALPQMDPSGMENVQGKHDPQKPDAAAPGGERHLPDVAPWRRMIVAFCGPLGNLLLAVLLAWIVYFAPNAQFGGDAAVGLVTTNSPAYAAGLRAGDRVVAVNGARVATWDEFLIETHLSGDLSNGVAVAVTSASGPRTLRLPVARDPDTKIVGIDGVQGRFLCIIGSVSNDLPAARAGLRRGDIITHIKGVELTAGFISLIEQLQAGGPHELPLTLRRGRQTLNVTLTPILASDPERLIIGVTAENALAITPQWMQYRRPLLQLRHDVKGIVRILRALLAPRVRGEAGRAAEGLGGPLIIFTNLYYQVREGAIVSLAFLRFLCVNLALLNLLPLPVLDGGHIMFALWEIITRRKPHPKFVNVVANIFAVLLISLMLLLVFRDARLLNRLFGRANREIAAAAASQAEADAPNTNRVPAATP